MCACAVRAHMVPPCPVRSTAHMTQTGVQDRYVGRARRARHSTGATDGEGGIRWDRPCQFAPEREECGPLATATTREGGQDERQALIL